MEFRERLTHDAHTKRVGTKELALCRTAAPQRGKGVIHKRPTWPAFDRKHTAIPLGARPFSDRQMPISKSCFLFCLSAVRLPTRLTHPRPENRPTNHGDRPAVAVATWLLDQWRKNKTCAAVLHEFEMSPLILGLPRVTHTPPVCRR